MSCAYLCFHPDSLSFIRYEPVPVPTSFHWSIESATEPPLGEISQELKTRARVLSCSWTAESIAVCGSILPHPAASAELIIRDKVGLRSDLQRATARLHCRRAIADIPCDEAVRLLRTKLQEPGACSTNRSCTDNHWLQTKGGARRTPGHVLRHVNGQAHWIAVSLCSKDLTGSP